MGFDWREFLALARALQNLEGEGFTKESAIRSAVSRSYYAVFCYVRNEEEKKGRFRRTGGPEDHRLLREHLKTMGLAHIASKLQTLRMNRNNCDYEDVVPDLKDTLHQSLLYAEEIIKYFSF